ncbi:hypothetical protein TREES_T100010612 [Tupaia chinensis]|uniref:Uncharacterized protein n=1 Tax=Tupaia chinensis TaxID=246437 RepID=L9L954_TUPCH|nr:hypothetical protein TREES_T100010612 [Tupaia chinensis]
MVVSPTKNDCGCHTCQESSGHPRQKGSCHTVQEDSYSSQSSHNTWQDGKHKGKTLVATPGMKEASIPGKGAKNGKMPRRKTVMRRKRMTVKKIMKMRMKINLPAAIKAAAAAPASEEEEDESEEKAMEFMSGKGKKTPAKAVPVKAKSMA